MGISSLVYGPVPSRRLGRSLGVNNIPPKVCSYSCVYCQLGRTEKTQVKRQIFYEPEGLANSVYGKVRQLREKNEPIDYIAFVPDGEPTLDANLGKEIDLLKKTGIKTAVITNSSIIQREDVREDLRKADWVCLKVDAVTADVWKRINRPYATLNINNILEGILGFAGTFKGELTTETMLIRNINDDISEINKIAGFLEELKPAKAYLSVPTRPTAEQVKPASERSINAAFQTFSKKLKRVECITGYEGNAFSSTGNAREDLLSITAVHPMREDAVQELLNRSGKGRDTVQRLVSEGSLVEVKYHGKKFYARRTAGTIPDNRDINPAVLK